MVMANIIATLPPRCVKCAAPHKTKGCTKLPNTPVKCALCNGPHRANYKGCPSAPYNKAPNKDNSKKPSPVKQASVKPTTKSVLQTPKSVVKAASVSPADQTANTSQVDAMETMPATTDPMPSTSSVTDAPPTVTYADKVKAPNKGKVKKAKKGTTPTPLLATTAEKPKTTASKPTGNTTPVNVSAQESPTSTRYCRRFSRCWPPLTGIDSGKSPGI